MDTFKTRESQYQQHVSLRDEQGLTPMGLMANAIWDRDPRLLAIKLSRYKFVSKMLSGKHRVLEVGCADAFATRIVLQEVGAICAIDIDPVFVQDVNERMDKQWTFDCRVHDMVSDPVQEEFDAAYAIDVLEHIPTTDEHRFMCNIAGSIVENGVVIMGLPSTNSQAYASAGSKEGHVNCKDHDELKTLMQTYFHNVFIFSMNDEVVHTGFYAMAQYLFAIGAGKK